MATTNVSNGLVVVDTNILLAATDLGRASHGRALDFLNQDTRTLALTPQIVREYLAVATRPVSANGLGMSGKDAAANMHQFLEDIRILPEKVTTTRHVIDLVERESSLGKQVHDANIVAVALEHGAQVIVTDNMKHFARFSDKITVEELH
jgi:predicted nucleic acid-binding protein